MRIISGHARGINLNAPPGDGVRPTTDRVKESVFASLGPVDDLRILDLFAGSGALGLEALSRGAASCVFIERDRRHIRVLESNLARVRNACGRNCNWQTTVLAVDVRTITKTLAAAAFDIIIADPPYAPGAAQLDAAALVAWSEFADWAGDALLLLEHPSAMPLPWAPESKWTLRKQKIFGTTTFSFATN